MNTSLLEIEKKAGTYWLITLNRAEKRNALSDDLVGELLDCLAQASAQCVPVLVFRGAGRNFSAGFDFGDFDQVSHAELLWRFVRVQQLLSTVNAYPGLTVALAHGRNFGAGCDLIAACSMRLATPDASFRMPGVLFGLILGTRHLSRLVGESAARRILLSAQEFSCDEAQRIGFVTGSVTNTNFNDPDLLEACNRLSPAVRSKIIDATGGACQHEDMGRLVASVMEGDIKQRLAAYLGR